MAAKKGKIDARISGELFPRTGKNESHRTVIKESVLEALEGVSVPPSVGTIKAAEPL